MKENQNDHCAHKNRSKKKTPYNCKENSQKYHVKANESENEIYNSLLSSFFEKENLIEETKEIKEIEETK